ncbi:uncharacterized protein LOC123290420 [Chrysoperla carnea]|uniref:uncharacterized protein LOC123290420 n=1 Tax=Chrysoperla carnea TaxID=189513 RepID=UPI001D082ED6|nr:uncharacterized protein LOC123290420 [Chrysoperla carnea]
MDGPAPAGYYYQPSGGEYAQYIGKSIPSNFQLPPMAPHYQDPNSPTPMPGFYYIDGFGNPPQYLGVNPPKRERGNENQKQGMSSSSAGTRRSAASNRSKGSYFEYGMIKTDENPQGEFFYSYTDSEGLIHYMVPDSQDAYPNPNNPNQSQATQYTVPKNMVSNSQGVYSSSNNTIQSSERYNRPPPSRIKSTNETSPSMEYIPPLSNRPQDYERTQNNQRYNAETKDKPTYRIKSTNESSPSMDYIPPFNTRPQVHREIFTKKIFHQIQRGKHTMHLVDRKRGDNM